MATMDTSEAPAVKSNSGKGCLFAGIGGGCLVILLACGGLLGFGVFAAFGLLKSSDPYRESLQRAQQNAELREVLGEPIEAEFFVQGNISLNNDRGDANLQYTVSGPNGSADIQVVGQKADGEWVYESMDATVNESGAKIDLSTD